MSDEQWAPYAPTPLAEVVTAEAPPAARRVRVEGYTDLVEFARGGDSIVYRAHQVSVGRDVAIKVLSGTESAASTRFERELKITVRLGRQHPHIVNVLDVTHTDDGDPCLVMDLHDLGSLHDRLRAHGPLPISEVVAAGTAVADALSFAHAAGILHRDVKPQNILLLPTSYVLSDFGIARIADAGHTATMERFSYRHASPQVLDGLPPSKADDIWSLGSTLFTLLDGRAPFASADPHDDTALGYLRRVRTGERRQLRRDDLPQGLHELIESCLRHDPALRPPSAAQALTALRDLRTEDRSWDPASPNLLLDDPTAGAPVGEPGEVHDEQADGEHKQDDEPGLVVPSTEDPADGDPVRCPASAAQDRAARDSSERTGAAWAPGRHSAPPASAPGTTADDTDGDQPDARAQAGPVPASMPQSTHDPAPVLAPSALAHVQDRPERAGDDPDGEATGMLAVADDGARADAPAKGRSGGGTTWRRTLAFFSGVLLAGLALGIGYQVLDRMTASDPEPEETPESAEVPGYDGEVPVNPGPDQATVGDPALAPQSLVLSPRGTSAELSWAPAQQDVDFYVVVVIPERGAVPEVLRAVQPHVHSFVVEGLDPDNPSECYAVTGHVNDENGPRSGASELVCRA